MPDFTCRFSQPPTAFPHFWEHTVGSGHAPLALRADWQAQMRSCHEDLGFQYVRFHALLSDEQWATLIQKLTAHWVERYGAAEVRTWLFEVWNEPNLEAFWTGPQEGYFKLYGHTVTAIKSVDTALQVGGPATANSQWIPDFLDYCRNQSLSVDFVSTHHYPTDAFGTPGADTITQLEHALSHGMRDQAAQARAEAGDLPLYYTEWNVSSNPRDDLHDEAFAAAFITRIIMEARGLVRGYSFWTFSDIFIAKPAYRAFRLLHHSGTELSEVEGAHATVDAWGIRGDGTATVLITNLAMPRHPIHTELMNVWLSGAPAPRTAWIERIDDDHANPRRLWQKMGEPEYLSALQVQQLEAASVLQKEPQPWTYDQGNVGVAVALTPQSVAAITIEFA